MRLVAFRFQYKVEAWSDVSGQLTDGGRGRQVPDEADRAELAGDHRLGTALAVFGSGGQNQSLANSGLSLPNCFIVNLLEPVQS